MFTQMRSAFTLQRALVNERAIKGEQDVPALLTGLPPCKGRGPTGWTQMISRRMEFSGLATARYAPERGRGAVVWVDSKLHFASHYLEFQPVHEPTVTACKFIFARALHWFDPLAGHRRVVVAKAITTTFRLALSRGIGILRFGQGVASIGL
jgi:hypothetical protein